MKALEYRTIPINQIEVSLSNARRSDVREGIDELAKSIDEHNLLQPIVVYEKEDKYQLIIGQRRYLACKEILRWKEIPARIIKVKNETDAAIISFSENIHRLDLSYKDKMRVAIELKAILKSVKKVSEALGVTDQTVRNYLGYEAVPEAIKDMVANNKLSVQTATDIARNISDEKQAIEIAKEVIETSRPKRKLVIGLAKENPSKTRAEIRNLAKKVVLSKITIHLTARISVALNQACHDFKSEPEDIGIMAVEEWLDERGFLK